MAEGTTQPKVQQSRRFIIEPTLVIYFTFYFNSYSLFGQYIYYSIGEKYNLTDRLTEIEREGNASLDTGQCGAAANTNNSVYILQQSVQAEAAIFTTIIDLCAGVPTIITTLFFGTLTDRLGRKPGMLLPMIGMFFKTSVPIIQMTLRLPLELLILGHMLESFCGGYGALISACYAYLGDTVAFEERSKRIIIVEVCNAVCMAILSIGIGIVTKEFGFFWPFLIHVCGHVLNFIYTLFFVPETLKKKETKERVSPLYVLQSFKVLSRKREGRGRMALLIFLVTWILCSVSTFPRYNIEQLYKLNSPFCWNASQIGLYMAASMLMSGFAEVVVALCFLKRGGDLLWTKISLCSLILTFVIEAFSTKNWMLMILPLTGILGGLQPPVMKSMMSKLVSSNEQGAIFAVCSAIDNMVFNVSAVIFNLIYAATLLYFKGTVFLLMASLMGTALVMLFVFDFIQQKPVKQETYVLENAEKETVFTVKL